MRDGYFAVHGLAADTEVPVYFLDAEHSLGATTFLSGRSAADGPITVRLQPCGAARARLVDPAGKPVPRSRDNYGSHMTMMVVSPGPHSRLRPQGEDQRGSSGGGSRLRCQIRPDSLPEGPGFRRPGAAFSAGVDPGRGVPRLRAAFGMVIDDAGPQLRKEFTVKPGEVLELGDILIEKPKP